MSNLSINGRFILHVGTSKKGNVYHALICDLGYRKVFLTFDSLTIALLLGISLHELLNIEMGDHVVDICTDVLFGSIKDL